MPDRTIYETLKKFFGEEWINEKLGKVKLSGFNDMNPMNLAAIRIHPLIRAILDTQIKLDISGQNSEPTVPIGRAETFQDLLHKNLSILENELDFIDTQHRLRDKTEFPKIEYEISVASGYKRMGLDVKFLPRQKNKRTGEFYLTDSLNNKILIECKKKDMVSPKQEKIISWWDELQHLLSKNLKNRKKYYGILIYLTIDPPYKDKHLLKNEILKVIDKNIDGEFNFLDKYKVILKNFTKNQNPVSAEIVDSFFPTTDMGVMFVKQSTNAWPLGKDKPKEYLEPIVVKGVLPPNDFFDEKIKSVMNTVKDAYGQLDSDKPNIIYIDINFPSTSSEKSFSIMRLLQPIVDTKLKSDYSNISAIVLTDQKILGHSGISGYSSGEYVIYNKNAKNPLPSEFKIYGDIKNGKSILEDIKELLFKDKKYDKIIPRSF